MRRIKIFLPLFFCFGIQMLPAQKKVILEELRYGSVRNFTMTYWKMEDTRKTFASHLNTILLKYWHLPLADTLSLNLHKLNEDTRAQKTPMGTHYTDTADLHMFLDVLENIPQQFFFFEGKNIEDSTIMMRARTVFQLHLVLEKGVGKVIFNGTLDMIVSNGNTPGMGIESVIVSMMPKSFNEILKAGLTILLNPENDLLQIELKVAPAFALDNYILPRTLKQPRTYVTTTGGISTYSYNNNREMIRTGEALYQEIKIKGKKPEKYPDALTNAIKNTANYSVSDYVFLRQDARDVLHDRNYQLQLVTQVDPGNPSLTRELAFTNFLGGNFHYLFREKDTIAVFAIQKLIPDPDKKIYPFKVSNGSDTTSVFAFQGKDIVWNVAYNYVATGKIDQQDFSINCSGFRNTIKEIYLNNKLVCIAQGKFIPEKFVVFDAPLSADLLKQLFMIGFNRFFE